MLILLAPFSGTETILGFKMGPYTGFVPLFLVRSIGYLGDWGPIYFPTYAVKINFSWASESYLLYLDDSILKLFQCNQ